MTRARRRLVGVTIAVLSGAALAIQLWLNGELGARMRDGIAAAVVSFLTGVALLTVLVAALPSGRRGLAALRTALGNGELRWWHGLGGVCGALIVVSQGITAAVLGAAVFTVALVAGQSGSSLAVDRAGLGPAGPQRPTGARFAGAMLSIAAVGLAVSDRWGTPRALALVALPALGGVGSAWQQAVNGRLREYAGSGLPAAFVNFVVGCATVVVAFWVEVAIRGWPAGNLPREPWLYLGGLIGVAFIAIAASLVRYTGVLLFGLGTIAGQLSGGVLVDLFFPGRHRRPDAATILGVVLTFVAVGLVALPTGPGWLRRRRRSARGTGGRQGRSPRPRC